MLLAESFFGERSDLQLLSLAQLDNEYVVFLAVLVDVAVLVSGRDRHHARVVAHQVRGGHVSGHLLRALDVQVELDAAVVTEIRARAVPRVLQSVDHLVRRERYEPDTGRYELVAQHGRVGVQLHPVNGQRRCLRDEHPAQAVGHTQVRVFDLELDRVGGQLGYVHRRLVGVWHFA